MKPPENKSIRGVTYTELLVTLVILSLLASVLAQTTTLMLSAKARNDTVTSMYRHGLRAMRTIIADLNQSAFRNVGGADFPYVFDGGVAVAPFSSHAHPPAASAASPGDPDYGPDREVVFVLPEDADNDGRPDLLGNSAVWSADEISYTVVTGSAGNELIRSVNNVVTGTMARHVERVVFDTPESSGYTIPLGTMRVQLFLRVEDKDGVVHRYQSETAVRLQFGGT